MRPDPDQQPEDVPEVLDCELPPQHCVSPLQRECFDLFSSEELLAEQVDKFIENSTKVALAELQPSIEKLVALHAEVMAIDSSSYGPLGIDPCQDLEELAPLHAGPMGLTFINDPIDTFSAVLLVHRFAELYQTVAEDISYDLDPYLPFYLDGWVICPGELTATDVVDEFELHNHMPLLCQFLQDLDLTSLVHLPWHLGGAERCEALAAGGCFR